MSDTLTQTPTHQRFLSFFLSLTFSSHLAGRRLSNVKWTWATGCAPKLMTPNEKCLRITCQFVSRSFFDALFEPSGKVLRQKKNMGKWSRARVSPSIVKWQKVFVVVVAMAFQHPHSKLNLPMCWRVAMSYVCECVWGWSGVFFSPKWMIYFLMHRTFIASFVVIWRSAKRHEFLASMVLRLALHHSHTHYPFLLAILNKHNAIEWRKWKRNEWKKI